MEKPVLHKKSTKEQIRNETVICGSVPDLSVEAQKAFSTVGKSKKSGQEGSYETTGDGLAIQSKVTPQITEARLGIHREVQFEAEEKRQDHEERGGEDAHGDLRILNVGESVLRQRIACPFYPANDI